ncbi:MAG: thioredoxin domain-containing protein [Gemmatimonadota bacterium]|nr:thioredoxin domain-containing protein [Gemmatimonadota bacterium]
MTGFVPSHRRLVHACTALLLVCGACRDTPPRAIADSAVAREAAAHSAPPAVAARDSSVSPTPAPAAKRGDTTSRSSRATTPVPRAAVRNIVFGGVDFTGIGYDRGKSLAPVVMIDLSDFACPYCGEFARDVYPTIDREYVQTGKVLFKYIPFVAGSFRHATEATRAAECAGEQGQFWVMMDRLYVTQAEWKSGNVADQQMAALAGTTPVDTVKFAACYADRHTDARTARATAVANEIGVRVTPSFLIDGHPVQGALPLAEFRRLIETALLVESSRKDARRGAPR